MPSIIKTNLNEVNLTRWDTTEVSGFNQRFLAIELPKNHGGIELTSIEAGIYFQGGAVEHVFAQGYVNSPKLDTSRTLSAQYWGGTMFHPFWPNPGAVEGLTLAFQFLRVVAPYQISERWNPDPLKIPAGSSLTIVFGQWVGMAQTQAFPHLCARGRILPYSPQNQEFEVL